MIAIIKEACLSNALKTDFHFALGSSFTSRIRCRRVLGSSFTERKSLGADHDSDATEQWHDGRRMGTVLSAIGNMLDSTAECLH